MSLGVIEWNLRPLAIIASEVLTDTVMAIKVDNPWRPTSRAVGKFARLAVFAKIWNPEFSTPAAMV
jgi:hypothetical protein